MSSAETLAPAAAFAVVAAGGALGSAARFAVQTALAGAFPGLPAGTALVNLAGSFAIGALMPAVDRWSPVMRPFLLVGVLGGFTTMSSFAVEVVALVQQERFAAAAAYWSGSAVLCVLACAAGAMLVR